MQRKRQKLWHRARSHQRQQHHGQRQNACIGHHDHRAHPDTHHHTRVDDAARSRTQGDESKPQGKAFGTVKALLKNSLHRRQAGKQSRHRQRLGCNRDHHDAVGEQFFRRRHQHPKIQRAAVFHSQSLMLPETKPQHDHRHDQDIDKENALPTCQSDDTLSHQRRHRRHHDEHHHHETHDLGHLAALELIAHDCHRHHAGSSHRHALQHAGDQQCVE